MGEKKGLDTAKVVFVKNLPYDATEEDLKNNFSHFGEIKRCFVVKESKSEDSKCRGFGYVTFSDHKSMKKSLKGKVEVRGRRLRMIRAKPRLRDSIKKKVEEEKEDDERDEEDEEDGRDKDGADYEEANTDAQTMDIDGEMPLKKSSESKNIDDDDDDEEEEDGGGGEKMEEDEEEEDYEEDDDEEEDEGLTGRGKKKEEQKVKKMVKENDAEEGRTLFVRNLSYEATEEDLFDLFEEFGDLTYCRVVINPQTDYSRGTAFVKFRRKDDADECLRLFEEDDSGFVIEGRKLLLMRALPKDRAVAMVTERKNNETLKRASQKNLHLVKLTMIRPGSKEAAGMSKEDARKRMKVEAMTKEKLRNPNIFVSSTRICIRNIPATVADKQLGEVFMKAAEDDDDDSAAAAAVAADGGKNKERRRVRIKECRIMRDLRRPNSEGVGKSKGYAFVEFTDAEHAMRAVLNTNNNPAIFGDDKRLIVEFSLENRAALETKEKRKFKMTSEDNRQNVTKRMDGGNSKGTTQKNALMNRLQRNTSIAAKKKPQKTNQRNKKSSIQRNKNHKKQKSKELRR